MLFFKALLFLGAGSVIHAVADEQDMRRMGGLKKLVPFTFAVMSIGSFALMGFPFFNWFLFQRCYFRSRICEVYKRWSFCLFIRNFGCFF